MNYQKIILVGNATGDAQIRKSQDGNVTFTTFRLGVADGKDRATFFPIVLFGRSVEKLAKLITKGRQVLLEGRIQVEKDRFDVIADRVELGTIPKGHPAAETLDKVERSEQSNNDVREKDQA
jgi:single-strand DNA-binding protein